MLAVWKQVNELMIVLKIENLLTGFTLVAPYSQKKIGQNCNGIHRTMTYLSRQRHSAVPGACPKCSSRECSACPWRIAPEHRGSSPSNEVPCHFQHQVCSSSYARRDPSERAEHSKHRQRILISSLLHQCRRFSTNIRTS